MKPQHTTNEATHKTCHNIVHPKTVQKASSREKWMNMENINMKRVRDGVRVLKFQIQHRAVPWRMPLVYRFRGLGKRWSFWCKIPNNRRPLPESQAGSPKRVQKRGCSSRWREFQSACNPNHSGRCTVKYHVHTRDRSQWCLNHRPTQEFAQQEGGTSKAESSTQTQSGGPPPHVQVGHWSLTSAGCLCPAEHPAAPSPKDSNGSVFAVRREGVKKSAIWATQTNRKKTITSPVKSTRENVAFFGKRQYWAQCSHIQQQQQPHKTTTWDNNNIRQQHETTTWDNNNNNSKAPRARSSKRNVSQWSQDKLAVASWYRRNVCDTGETKGKRPVCVTENSNYNRTSLLTFVTMYMTVRERNQRANESTGKSIWQRGGGWLYLDLLQKNSLPVNTSTWV